MATAQAQMQVDFTQVINELANRLRILESKQNLFSERLLVMNQNMIEEYKKTQKDIKTIHVEIDNLKKDLANLKNVMRHLTEEASKFARNEDVKMMQKYVELWNPLTFVTEKEVKRMIEEALHHRGPHMESEVDREEAAEQKEESPPIRKTHEKHEDPVFVEQPLVPKHTPEEKHTKKSEHKTEHHEKHSAKDVEAKSHVPHALVPETHHMVKPKESKKAPKKVPTNIDEAVESWLGE